jgi:nucleoside-diphosphate-sugar epimerase
MEILVTGATGFLGRHVVNALSHRGHKVRALYRKPPQQAFLWSPGLSIKRFSLDLCSDRVDAALTGVDAVIHLAAQVRGSPKAVIENTLNGTRRLLCAMNEVGVTRLVLASSLSVYDWNTATSQLDENSPLEAHIEKRGAYTIAKYTQEQLVRDLCSFARWNITVLRPGALWGRGCEYPGVIGKVIGPLYLVFGPDRPLPLAYVENCADAFAAVLDNPKATGETFNVLEDKMPRAWDYAGEYLLRRLKHGVRIGLPYEATYKVLKVVCSASRASSIPDRFEARFKPLQFGNRKLADQLGWRPPFSYEECLLRTFSFPS